jgi:hypothetical protein
MAEIAHLFDGAGALVSHRLSQWCIAARWRSLALALCTTTAINTPGTLFRGTSLKFYLNGAFIGLGLTIFADRLG